VIGAVSVTKHEAATAAIEMEEHGYDDAVTGRRGSRFGDMTRRQQSARIGNGRNSARTIRPRSSGL